MEIRRLYETCTHDLHAMLGFVNVFNKICKY